MITLLQRTFSAALNVSVYTIGITAQELRRRLIYLRISRHFTMLYARIPVLAGLRLMCLYANFMTMPPHKRVNQQLTAIRSVFCTIFIVYFL